MTNLKLTKSALRDNQDLLNRINKFLPMVKIKKQLLFIKYNEYKKLVKEKENELSKAITELKKFEGFLKSSIGDKILSYSLDPKVQYGYDNIAGVEIKIPKNINIKKITFCNYSLSWQAEEAIRASNNFGEALVIYNDYVSIAKLLKKEFKKASIKASLFENNIAMKCRKNISKISEFLMDQELISLGQSKTMKILKNQNS